MNIKVGLIGALDMLKFKNMAKKRETVIRTTIAKDIVCEYPINNNAKALHPDKVELFVKDVINHNEAGSKTYVFGNRNSGALPYFRAGQYISLKLKIGDSFVTRAYSLSSSPNQALEGIYEITVKTNPNGFAADWILENLRREDQVEASAPQGNFYYDKYRDEKNVIAVAGGSGITPFLSMAKAIRDGNENFILTILYGSRTADSILHKKELDEIAHQTDKVKVTYVLSDEEKEGYEYGFITADLIAKHAPVKYSVFMCGPEMMYKFVGKEIEKLELSRRQIRTELMGVPKKVWELPGYPEKLKDEVFNLTVKQGHEKYKIKARADEPILVAIERAGIKAPSRCRSGECGWCRSRLLTGEVYIPEGNDGRRWADCTNNYIHPCATYPLSDAEIEVPFEY